MLWSYVAVGAGIAFLFLLLFSFVGLVIAWVVLAARWRSLLDWRWHAVHLSFLQAWVLWIGVRFGEWKITYRQLEWTWCFSMLASFIGLVSLFIWLSSLKREERGNPKRQPKKSD